MWVKTGDEFIDDAADLSDAAVRTHMDALHWNARRMLDLHIPKRDLPRFAFSPTATTAIDELIASEWWLDQGDSWYLAHRPEWQLSKQQVQNRRYKNAQSQERGRRHRDGDHSLCIPGKCMSAADSAADSSDDSADDSASDPARFGSVRETKELTTHLGSSQVQGCVHCDRSNDNPSTPCPFHGRAAIA